MAQYDSLVIKSGIPTIIGTDTLRADRGAHAGLTTTGLASGDVVQVSGALTLQKAVNTSTSPIIGIYDGVTGSVVREGVVVATFKSGLTLAAGNAVYLSDEDGKLTNVKPVYSILHEVGVIVDASTSKVLLQQKPVISLPPPPPMLWVCGLGRPLHKRQVDTAAYIARVETPDLGGSSLAHPTFDGTNIWVVSDADPGRLFRINASTHVITGPYLPGLRYSGLTFDGTYLWAANAPSGTAYKINLEGSVVGTYSTGHGWCGTQLCYDRVDSVWAYYDYYTLAKIRCSDGVVTATVGIVSDTSGMCADGLGYLWVGLAGSVKKIRLSDNTVVGTFSNGSDRGGKPCFDGTNIWQGVGGGEFMRCWKASDGSFVRDVNCGAYQAIEGRGTAFDGTWIWTHHYYGLGSNYGWHKFLASDGSYIGTYIQSSEANKFNHGCSTKAPLSSWP